MVHCETSMVAGRAPRGRPQTSVVAGRAPRGRPRPWRDSRFSARLLDLLLIKDDAWRHTGLISTACYQKPVNRYLYLPFLTEMPRHVLEGVIRGEIIRYVKRCSAITPFLEMLRLFWTRLSVRGYPAHFLFETFRSAADYTQRVALLAKPAHSAAGSTRSQVLILTFSRSLHQAQL